MNKPVTHVLDDYIAAVYAKNVDDFVALYDNDIHVFDLWGTWEIKGIEAWRSMVEGWLGSLGSERVVVKAENVTSKQNAGLAFLSATLRFTAISPEGEKLRSLENRLTCVMEFKGGAWKIIHEHTSAPIDHGTLKASLARRA